ncbi:uncharacterized protein LOC130722385 [Lotus japonicus]|uniref:uncharacterized protein LOC130722385 n=1 Tax=Lotus japonicus TaxID=34305 RepID=UPI002590C8C3|nr:uncharacterized protein LOC130722385 [Lotus japonicus]
MRTASLRVRASAMRAEDACRIRAEPQGENETMNLDWEEALNTFQNVMALGTKPLKSNVIAKMTRFSEHAPEHVLSRVIPILTEILGQNIPIDHASSLQEVAA